MKPKVKQTYCPETTTNQCILWEGGDVPCLNICNGQQLSEAEKIIADKVCELVEDLDLSDVDLKCVLDKVSTGQDKSLQTIIQILFDNQCALKDLIDAAGGGTADVELNLNLKCLKKFDEFGNEIPQNLNQTLQSLVNQACQNKDDITALKSRVDDLEDAIDTIPTTPPTVEEAKVTTCLTPGLRSISQVVPLIANEICNFAATLGSVEQISNAISQQCDNLNSEYGTIDGWQTTVANMAQSISNMWIVLCNLKDRIELIETNCCAVTCDDIKLGFEVTPNDESTGIFLRFTSKGGTSIPIGFTDCGSIVTITDKNGISVEYPLVISNGAVQGDFDVTGLDLSDFITIEVTAKLCADGIGCEKCVSRLYKMGNALCPFCEITVTGPEGSQIVIVYED